VNGAIAHCPRHPLNYRSGHTRCEPALQQHSSMPTPQPPRNRRADRWHHFPRTRCGPSHNDPSDALGVPGRPQCTAWGSRCTLGRAGRTFDTPTVHPGVRKRPKGPRPLCTQGSENAPRGHAHCAPRGPKTPQGATAPRLFARNAVQHSRAQSPGAPSTDAPPRGTLRHPTENYNFLCVFDQ